jgi:hypothetical protein
VAKVLGAVALLLILVSTAFQVVKWVGGRDEALGLVGLTFLGSERNIPTMFSSLILAFAAMCCAVAAASTSARKMPDVPKWVILAAGFLYLAFDEALSLHEQMSVPVKKALGEGALGFRHTYWAIPALAGLIVVGLFFLGFLRRLPARTRFLFLLAGAVYIGGAIGIEMLTGVYYYAYGGERLGFNLVVTLEETFEMAGVILFIYAVLDYIARTFGEVRFRLAGA